MNKWVNKYSAVPGVRQTPAPPLASASPAAFPPTLLCPGPAVDGDVSRWESLSLPFRWRSQLTDSGRRHIVCIERAHSPSCRKDVTGSRIRVSKIKPPQLYWEFMKLTWGRRGGGYSGAEVSNVASRQEGPRFGSSSEWSLYVLLVAAWVSPAPCHSSKKACNCGFLG